MRSTRVLAAHGFGVVATEDPGVFTAARSASYAAVVWLNTSGVRAR